MAWRVARYSGELQELVFLELVEAVKQQPALGQHAVHDVEVSFVVVVVAVAAVAPSESLSSHSQMAQVESVPQLQSPGMKEADTVSPTSDFQHLGLALEV
jgi:hypothetical protein